MEIALVIAFVGLLVFLAHLFSKLFEKTRIPDVLILILVGLFVGPITGIISSEAFGGVGHVFTVVALVVILFESGLGLTFSTLRESMMQGIWLTVINFVVTVAVLDVLFSLMFRLSVLESLILGSILGGTSSAIVIPLVNKLRLQQGSRTLLILESTFSDVLCIVVTIGLIQTFKYHELRPSLILGEIIASFLLAAVIGGLAAFFWSTVLVRVRQLENNIFLTLAFVFIVFGVAELLGYSGAISSLSFGIVLGNIQNLPLPVIKRIKLSRPIQPTKREEAFFSEIVFLLKTFFFFYIGLSIPLTDIMLLLAGLGLTLVLFLIRIPVVKLALDTRISRFDASIVAVMVPKGLAAAVLSSLPQQAGMEKGIIIQNVVYAVILFSIITTTVLTFLIERGILRPFYASLFLKCAPDVDQRNQGT
jgi:cell volume regulation protein A